MKDLIQLVQQLQNENRSIIQALITSTKENMNSETTKD